MGKFLGSQRGLEGFGFGPVLVDLVAVFFLSCEFLVIKNVGFPPDGCAHL